jgi:hypothetical protein
LPPLLSEGFGLASSVFIYYPKGLFDSPDVLDAGFKPPTFLTGSVSTFLAKGSILTFLTGAVTETVF